MIGIWEIDRNYHILISAIKENPLSEGDLLCETFKCQRGLMNLVLEKV